MAGQGKIKEELLSELAQLRRQITRLQHAETERRQVKIALRESEDKYESIARAAIEGIYHADGEGRFVFVNDACTRILGYDRDELLGKHYSIIIPEAGIPMATEITRAAAQGDPQKGEFILKHKQGHGVPVHFSMVALGSPGERAGLTGIIQDITERKRAEEALQKARDELEMRVAERTMELELANEELRAEMVEREDAERALRESEEKYRNVVERANDMVAIVQDNLIKFVNQRVVDMAGYAPEEVICTALSQHIAPEERPVVMERYARRVAGEDVPPRYETTLFRKDGTTVDVEINAGVIMYEGRPADLVIVRDITERKKAEKALRESEERFRALIENAFEGIAILNADGIAVYASPAIERIAGIPSEEAVGKRLIELVHPDDRARFQENFTLAMREPGALVTGTYRALYANGRWHVVETTARNLIDDPKIGGLVLNFRDITERREAEEKAKEAEMLKEMCQLRGDLLANVSHELRTPLTTIKGYATALMDDEIRFERDVVKRRLESIVEACDGLSELVGNLLDVSRLEAGMLWLNRVPTDLSKILREAISQARIRALDHRIVLRLPEELPAVNADPKRIRQVVDNIIDNAVKYSGEGTEVTVSVRREGKGVVVSIADQGIGISAQELPKIFDRMYRAKTSLAPKKEGTGLGLTIARGLVEAHGGRIWMESEEWKGSTCSFNLPIDAE